MKFIKLTEGLFNKFHMKRSSIYHGSMPSNGADVITNNVNTDQTAPFLFGSA